MNTEKTHNAHTFGLIAPEQHADPLLAERGARYGAFIDNAKLSQSLKAVMRSCQKWEEIDSDMKEALEMIAHKISRILCGDPYYDDSWVDVAGYATRVADRLIVNAELTGQPKAGPVEWVRRVFENREEP